MSDRATLQAELLLLSGKVRDDTLTPGDAARLDELLQADDAAKALYVRYMSVVSLLESRGLGQRITSEEPEPAEVIDHNVFAELLELEARAEAELVEKPKELHLFVPSKKTPLQLGGAMQWVIQQPAFWSGAAAVLVIAITLALVFGGDDNEPAIDTAQQPVITNTPNESIPVAPVTQAVATITATHDAQWVEPVSARGSQLYAGQTLTLTAGFAEITTAQGAIAILEAPATIELTHNDNALRLHAGKLVGICETESSKGFVVRTPHMAITDLGTRFGVDASAADATEVHVLEGEVAARLSDATPDTPPTLLIANQSARISADTETIARIDHDAQAFTHLLPSEQSPLALNNTDQLRTASNNPFFAAGQVDLVGVNFYYSSTSGNPKNNAPRDTPAGPVNGVAFDNIDMWNGATDIAPAPGPYALSANAAGPSLTITAPFTYNDSRSQRSRITGADAKHLRAVADEFLHLDRKSPSITLAFANLGVDEGTPLYVQLIGGDSGWHGGMSISANGASIGAWAVCDRDITTAPLHAFETTAASDGRLTLDLTGTGSFAGLAGVIISAAPGQPTPPEQPRP